MFTTTFTNVPTDNGYDVAVLKATTNIMTPAITEAVTNINYERLNYIGETKVVGATFPGGIAKCNNDNIPSSVQLPASYKGNYAYCSLFQANVTGFDFHLGRCDTAPPDCRDLTVVDPKPTNYVGDKLTLRFTPSKGGVNLGSYGLFYIKAKSDQAAYCTDPWTTIKDYTAITPPAGGSPITVEWNTAGLTPGEYIVATNVKDSGSPTLWCTGNPGGTCNVATKTCTSCSTRIVIAGYPMCVGLKASYVQNGQNVEVRPNSQLTLGTKLDLLCSEVTGATSYAFKVNGTVLARPTGTNAAGLRPNQNQYTINTIGNYTIECAPCITAGEQTVCNWELVPAVLPTATPTPRPGG